MSKLYVLLDNGHGCNTEMNGKFSPFLSDVKVPEEFVSKNRFREWKYNRAIALEVYSILKEMGYDVKSTDYYPRKDKA